MITWRGVAAWSGAAVALAYLAAMVGNGAMPVQRQLVRSEANGVLKVAPEAIRRVELSRGDQRLALRRSGDTRWLRPDGSEVDPVAVGRVGTAIRMMHRSGPVREMTPEELEGVDPSPFELEHPRIVVALYETAEQPVLTARFGGRNPEDFLQYMQIDGDRRILLMSRFIGEEWVGALEAMAKR